MKVFLGADHGGFQTKELLKAELSEQGFDVVDLGTTSEESVDYPDFAAKVAKSVVTEQGSRGILVCGSGIGMCIAANKVAGISAALVYSDDVARLSREHNDSNVACFGGRTQKPQDVLRMALLWLGTDFSGEARHKRRLAKIAKLR
ncbi:ribose 5-phosphate isomerase B [Candidatus Micrarchaeota archaeon CG1_02_55_22]|nr:MAG: ribose 5-phosphate isomerase B [Candidatus Micrarchaeota archaeon CG1_02_55_22]